MSITVQAACCGCQYIVDIVSGKIFTLTEKNAGKVQCIWVPAPSLPCLVTCGTQDDVSVPSSVACLGQIPTTPASEFGYKIPTALHS